MAKAEERIAEKRDALGRRRQPQQNRGLRSLFPKLPHDTQSRLVRIAMSGRAWERLEQLVSQAATATKPRAYGEVLEHLLDNLSAPSPTSPELKVPVFLTSSEQEEEVTNNHVSDWQAWQMQKERALLSPSLAQRGQSPSPEWVN